MRRRVPWPAVVVTVLVMLFLYAPILLVLVNSVNADTNLLRWEGFTTRWYREALEGDDVRDAFMTSVNIAVLSSLEEVSSRRKGLNGRQGRGHR